MAVTFRIVAIAAILAGAPAHAQYDRDGRYVPSPMGVPADPYARTVPLYPGTPGGAIGTPIWPRGTQQPPITSTTPQLNSPQTRPSNGLSVQRRLAACDRGWSEATGLSRKGFEKRCAQLYELLNKNQ